MKKYVTPSIETLVISSVEDILTSSMTVSDVHSLDQAVGGIDNVWVW